MADTNQDINVDDLVNQAKQSGLAVEHKDAADQKAADEAKKNLLKPGQWVNPVLNLFGLDDRLPSGYVEVVNDANGNWVGYVKNGKLMPLINTPEGKVAAAQAAPKPKIDVNKINNEQAGYFQRAQHLEVTAAAEYEDLKVKALIVARGYPLLEEKQNLEQAAKLYKSTIDAIKDSYFKSGVVQGEIKLNYNGTLSTGSTFVDPMDKKAGPKIVTTDGAVPIAKAPSIKSTGGLNDPLLTNYTVYTAPDHSEYVTGTGSTKPMYFVPPAKTGDTAGYTDDINAAKAAMIKSAGGIDKLDKALRAAGYSGTFDANLSNAINAYSTKALRTYQAAQGKGNIGDASTFISTLAATRLGAGGTGGTGGPRVTQNFIDRAGSDRYVNKYFMDNFGTAATDADKIAFYNDIHSLELRTKTVTTNGTSVGSQLTNADYDLVAAKVGQKFLKGTSVDTLMNSTTPGQLTNDVNKLVQFAASYAVPMTTQQALNALSGGLGQANYLAGQEDRIKQLAMTLHPTLAPHIKAGGTVKDVADTYANIKTRKLGVAVPDSTADKDVMAAVTHPNGPVNQNQFELDLQKNPAWRTSPEAIQLANNYLETMGKSWGLI